MKLAILLVSAFLFSNITYAQNTPCVSRDMAANAAAEVFMFEYWGSTETSIFDDTFKSYFDYGGYNENIHGVKNAFLTDQYRFDGLNHIFSSRHIYTSGDDTTHVEFADFDITVSCTRDNEITAKSRVDGFSDPF